MDVHRRAAALTRGAAYARRFPRPFWYLVLGGSAQSLGAGLFVPYWALYLTGSLGASGAQAGALLALAGGMGIVGAPLGGLLSDRIGRRPTLLVGTALGGVGFVLYGSLSSLAAIAVLTPFFAISSDLWSPAVSAAVVDLVDPELRAEAFGLRRQISNVAFALGPALGGLLTLGVALRWLFVVAGVVELLVFGFYAVTVPETRPAAREGEPPARLRDAARDRLLLLLALGTALGTLVYVQFDSVLGVFLHRERGVALSTWGLLFAINPVLVGVFQYVVARWAGRRSARAMLALGCVLQGVALFVLWPLTGLVAVAVAVVVLTCGEMLLSPVASALAATLAPARLRGSYEGVVDFAFAVAWMPAVFVGLWLVGAGRGELVLALALPISVLGALCFLPLPRGAAAAATPVAPLAEEVAPV